MSDQRKRIQDEVRFRVLRLIDENHNISQRELARAVGISTGGAHYVLNALIEKGLVKLGRFAAATDKRRYVYALTPKGLAEKVEITRIFLARKMEEYDALKAEIESLQSEIAQQDRDNLEKSHG